MKIPRNCYTGYFFLGFVSIFGNQEYPSTEVPNQSSAGIDGVMEQNHATNEERPFAARRTEQMANNQKKQSMTGQSRTLQTLETGIVTSEQQCQETLKLF